MTEANQQEPHSDCPICSYRQHLATTASAVDEEARALEDAARIRAGLAAIEEWEAEHGPISAEALARAEEAFDEAFGSSREPSDK